MRSERSTAGRKAPERQTHDYKRHGTTTLFAALNVLDGTVISSCLPRRRHSEFLRFLDKVDGNTSGIGGRPEKTSSTSLLGRNHRLAQAEAAVAGGHFGVRVDFEARVAQAGFEQFRQQHVLKCAAAEADAIQAGTAAH